MKSRHPRNRQLERYKRILQRQPASGYISPDKYIPAIKATREEAPPDSRPTILCDRNKIGRAIHALSHPEKAALLLALYAPCVCDVNEQRALPEGPGLHPLEGHQQAPGEPLSALPGTTAMYKALDALDVCSVFRFTDDSGRRRIAASPLVGDILLYVRDDKGLYCKNVTVKKSEEDFRLPFGKTRSREVDANAIRKHLMRQAVEEALYRQCGICTERFTLSTFSPDLLFNLEAGFAWQARFREIKSLLPEGIVPRVRALLVAAIGSHSLLDIWKSSGRGLAISMEQFKSIAFTLIWERVARVDLFARVLFDRRLEPERRDVMQVYGHLFARA